MSSIFSITTEGEEALGAATAETVLALIGSTVVKARLVEWSVDFDGVLTTAEPVRVRLIRLTADDGTRTTTVTEVPWDPDNPTANCVGRKHFTAEPTKGDVIWDKEVHPQGGFHIQYPLGREPTLDNSASVGFAIECTAAAAVNCVAAMAWEE
jgi:hypothetical protein